jgi:Right handed beta helix region
VILHSSRRRITLLAPAAALLLAATVAFTPGRASAASFETNDTSSSISYSSGWSYGSTAGYAFGDAHYSATVGATATIAFSGTSIELIGARDADGGRSNVKVCNGTGGSCTGTTMIDFYSATTTLQQSMFSASGLASGAHELIVSLRSDTSGTNFYSDIDAFVADNGATAITGTHYVDNATGSGCSDTGTGTSTTSPWCDFAPIQGQALAPGAQVLLKRGDSWNGPLQLTGSGTSGSQITLGAYGTAGARPVIHGSGLASDRTVVIQNPDYWHIQNLELTNAGEGLVVEYTSLGHHSLDIEGLYAHDLSGILDATPRQADYPDLQNSTAITISAGGAPTPTSGQTVLAGLTVRGNTVHNTAGVYVLDDPTLTGTPAAALTTFTGVNISHNTFSTSVAPILAVEAAEAPVVESNWVDCSGHVAEPQGTTCFFVSDVDGALIQNNAITNMPDTGSFDETGIDFEYKVSNNSVRGNFFGTNAGAGIELLQLAGRAGDYSTGNLIEENDFYNNGGASTAQQGQIAVFGGTPPTVTIQHNDYELSPHGFISAANGAANTANVTQTDNIAVSVEYPAALHFSSVQGSNGWHEQSYSGTGSSWTDMPTYSSTTAQWTASSASSIDAFVLNPGATASQWVAREWIAPHVGTVVIRGRVFKDDTSGPATSVLIERNGTSIWPTGGGYTTISGSDTSGANAGITLTVATGDVIRFVVYGAGVSTGTATSWTPAIDYE